MKEVLDGIDAQAMEVFLRNLVVMKDNLRAAINRNANNTTQQSALVESL